MPPDLSDFQAFFLDVYQRAWNDLDAGAMGALSSPALHVRWAYPGNRIADWGPEQARRGWRDAFQSYAGRGPRWRFHEVLCTAVDEREVLAVYWVTFEVEGSPTDKVNLFVETFRKEDDGWRLIRSYVESSLPRRFVTPSLDGTAPRRTETGSP